MKSLKCKMLPLLFVLLVLLTGCARDGEVEPTIPRWHSLRQKAEYPVSYTHLTLPTTPYV